MQSIIKVITERKSVRNYKQDDSIKDLLSLVEIKIIELTSKPGPFGNYINIDLVTNFTESSEVKLGTYGMIKGANNYLVVSAIPNTNYLLDLGYVFEQLILYVTKLGMGTVWMAGTFSRKQFKNAVKLDDKAEMPIVSPIGFAGGKKSFLSKYVAGNKSHVRKDFSTLFFANDGKKGLIYDEANIYHLALEMVRLAPSAMNKQPWRVVEGQNQFHFYKSGRSKALDIDLGIALCHFALTLNTAGITGSFHSQPNDILNNYCMTWTKS